jgi:hypothetical protein
MVTWILNVLPVVAVVIFASLYAGIPRCGNVGHSKGVAMGEQPLTN